MIEIFINNIEFVILLGYLESCRLFDFLDFYFLFMLGWEWLYNIFSYFIYIEYFLFYSENFFKYLLR